MPLSPMPHPRQTEIEFHKAIYEATRDKWKYFQNLRYGVIAANLSAHGFLITMYWMVLENKQVAMAEGRHYFELPNHLLWFIPIAAFVWMGAVWYINHRLRMLYTECSMCGESIERSFGLANGIFTRCNARVPPARWRMRGWPIGSLWGLTALFWLYVFWFGYNIL